MAWKEGWAHSSRNEVAAENTHNKNHIRDGSSRAHAFSTFHSHLSIPNSQLAREADIYTVIDADGLWLLQKEPSIIIGHKKAVLTPNVAEFGRLCSAMKIDPKEGEEEEVLKKLTLALKGPTILQKGKEDLISNGR